MWINPHTEEREGPLNYSNTPEEVLVWEEMDALTWVIHNEWNGKKTTPQTEQTAGGPFMCDYGTIGWNVCTSQMYMHVFILLRGKATGLITVERVCVCVCSIRNLCCFSRQAVNSLNHPETEFAAQLINDHFPFSADNSHYPNTNFVIRPIVKQVIYTIITLH